MADAVGRHGQRGVAGGRLRVGDAVRLGRQRGHREVEADVPHVEDADHVGAGGRGVTDELDDAGHGHVEAVIEAAKDAGPEDVGETGIALKGAVLERSGVGRHFVSTEERVSRLRYTL